MAWVTAKFQFYFLYSFTHSFVLAVYYVLFKVAVKKNGRVNWLKLKQLCAFMKTPTLSGAWNFFLFLCVTKYRPPTGKVDKSRPSKLLRAY